MQDFNQLSLKKFVETNQVIEEVSKQLAAWEKYSKAKLSPPEKCSSETVISRGKPPESPVARAQASVRSKSNNPLALSEEFCPKQGHISQLHQKNCAINSEVIISLAGNRNNSSAALNNQGSNGNYWSSSPNGTNAYNLNFNSSSVNPANNNNRANGFSVRCIKDLQVPVK